MTRLLALGAVAVGALISGPAALTQTPPPPWPPGKTQVFIAADTVTARSTYGYVPAVLGKQENFFPRTAGVKFRMYAIDLKTKKVLTAKHVQTAYVKIPGQPNVKLAYGKLGRAVGAPRLWTGTWSIPPDYPLGVVPFRILVKTKSKRLGSFQQAPVEAAQLTVSDTTAGTPVPPVRPGPVPPPPYPGKAVEIAMYTDTVTSSRGEVRQSRVCTQTNYFPRRSRVVFRMWAVDTRSRAALTPLDVKYVYIKIPGQPNLGMTFGPHGAAGNRVDFWSAAWAIPASYPLGIVPFRIVIKTEDGRFGIYRQPAIDGSQLTVIP
jgi:hypothetical protein